jgi:hypothetical protein
MGKGGGEIIGSGVRGFQRQEWRDQPAKQDGILDDETYQHIRRSRVPVGPNKGRPLLDSVAIGLINKAIEEYGPDAKIESIRKAITDFCLEAEANQAVWHYTQRRPYSGLGRDPEETHYNDCSSYAILAYYWARKTTGLIVPDPSGYAYSGYGNTWDDLDGHPRVTTGSYQVADLAHYDGHVTICRKPGSAGTALFSSFGSESGPDPTELHYRGDFRKVVRPKLLA